MARLTRRNLLIGGTVAAALPTGLLVSHVASSRAGTIVDYLRAQLPGLAVSNVDLEGFADEYIARNVTHHGRTYFFEAIFLMMANPMLAAASPAPIRLAHEKFTRSLLTRFLLSTDFFTTGKQQPQLTTYLGFSDPYTVGCSNPLAQFGPGT
jgi:hypothetical protein